MTEVAQMDEMDPMSEAKDSFGSLFAWIETFHTLDNHLKYEDLVEQQFLFEVVHQVDGRPFWAEPISCAKDPASQIHNASVLFIQLVTCYMDCFHQAVALPILDFTALVNYNNDLSASQQEMHKLLLLVLGLVIQSDRKDDFIAVMETLPSNVKKDIMESYKELSSQLVRLDTRDDSGAVLRRCSEDRLTYFKKYSQAMQEKHYLETVVLAAQNFAGPDLLKSLRPPEGLVDFHGYQLLLGSASQQAASLTAQLEDKAAEAAQLAAALQQKRDKAKRMKLQLKNLSVSDQALQVKNLLEENDRLRETLKGYEEMENEVATMRQRLTEFEFYKARVQELRDENSQLLEDRQCADERHAAMRDRAQEAAERLAECQLRCDELTGQRDADTERVAASADHLAAENRRLREALEAVGGGDDAAAAAALASAGPAASSASAPSLAAELATAGRIRDLQAEAKRLRAALADAEATAAEGKQREAALDRKFQQLVVERTTVAETKAAAEVAESKQRADKLEQRLQHLLAERAEETKASKEAAAEVAESKRLADECRRRAEAESKAEEFERQVQRLVAERAAAQSRAAVEAAESKRATDECRRRTDELERQLRQLLSERAQTAAELEQRLEWLLAERAAAEAAAAESEQRAAELERRLQQQRTQAGHRLEAAATTVATTTAAVAAAAETELVLQTSQELERHLARLGGNNRALRQSCEKLKAELGRLTDVEAEVMQLREAREADARELQRLEAQNRQLRRATVDSPSKAAATAPSKAASTSSKATSASSKATSASSKAAAALHAGRPRNSPASPATASGKRPVVDRSY